jgi:hypothetical protein
MNRKGLTRLLWLALLFTAPVPFFLVEIGLQPVAAMLQMLGFTLVLIAADGGAGAIALTAWILAAQIALAALLLRLVAYALAHMLLRTFHGRASAAAIALVAVFVLVAFTVPIYRTPFRTGGIYSTLPQVFE